MNWRKLLEEKPPKKPRQKATIRLIFGIYQLGIFTAGIVLLALADNRISLEIYARLAALFLGLFAALYLVTVIMPYYKNFKATRSLPE